MHGNFHLSTLFYEVVRVQGLLENNHLLLIVLRVPVPFRLFLAGLAERDDQYAIGSLELFPILQFYFVLDILQYPAAVAYLIDRVLQFPPEFLEKFGEFRAWLVIHEIIRY